MEKSQSIEILKEEYSQLQRMVEDFDARALTIKAWSVTLSAAGIVTAYVQIKPAVLLIAMGSALTFWLVEALWKLNQQAFYARLYEIESALASGAADTLAPLQIATSWSRSWHKSLREGKVLKILSWPHVFLPHALVSAAAALAYFVWPPA